MQTEYRIGITMYLPEEIGKQIVQVRDTLGIRYEGRGANHKPSPPHVTLYGSCFPQSNFEELLKKLKMIEQQKLSLVIDTVKQGKSYNKEGSVFLYVAWQNSDQLVELHRKVVEIGNSLREGLIRSNDLKKIQTGRYSQEERAHIQRYGFLRVMERFEPHVTIGEADQGDQKTVDSLREGLRFLDHKDIEFKSMSVRGALYNTETEERIEYLDREEIPLL